MKHLILILTVLIFGSCATQKRCTDKFPCTQESKRDSIYIEKIVKVPVPVKGDSILIEVPIDCPDQEVIISETGKLKQIISILNGKLKSQTNIKADTVYIPVKEITTVVKEVKVPTPVKFIPKFYKILLFFNIALVVLIGLYLYLRRKFFS